jgi:hypothetical protein
LGKIKGKTHTKGGYVLNKKLRVLWIFVVLTVAWSCLPALAYGGVTWTIKGEIDLTAPPLDVSESADGSWLFILIPGEILIYSIAEDSIVNRVPVEDQYDKLVHAPRSNTLILSSRSEKALKVIQLERIHEFQMSGLPFKGAGKAPVTIVTFSDYQ